MISYKLAIVDLTASRWNLHQHRALNGSCVVNLLRWASPLHHRQHLTQSSGNAGKPTESFSTSKVRCTLRDPSQPAIASCI